MIPYYNPGSSLTKHVREIRHELDKSGLTYEIIAVSDGSTDGSPQTISNLFPDVLTNLQLPTNHGKGEALRTGLSKGRGRYLGFIDADGDIPAFQLQKVVELIKTSSPDIITGSKRHPESEVIYPFLRRIYSWGYQQLIRALFHLEISDTQTGLKIAKREVVDKVLPLMVEKRFAFDLELFVLAKKLGYAEITEIPIVIKQRFRSTISPKAVTGMIADTLRVFYRLRIRHFYDE